MFKLNLDLQNKICSVTKFVLENRILSIPFDPANTDYQQFKKDIMAGGELQDADGNVMSADAAQEFVRSLP